MKKRMSGRTGLFLLELVISIFFFVIACAVCVQLYVKAHILDRENSELVSAVELVTNMAELYTIVDTGNREEYYNAEFEKCIKSEAEYVLRVVEVVEEMDEAGKLYTCSISLRKLEETAPVYALSLTLYEEADA
ncbi:MAG: hypothetical protein KBS85_04905 [Lachnospiraceae bacterium]|nr:hypothetical protein [Candidatus Merdinaster equi]